MEPENVAAAIHELAYRTNQTLMFLAGEVGSSTKKLQAIHELIQRYEGAGVTAAGLTKAIREIIGPDLRSEPPMAAQSFMSLAAIMRSTSA